MDFAVMNSVPELLKQVVGYVKELIVSVSGDYAWAVLLIVCGGLGYYLYTKFPRIDGWKVAVLYGLMFYLLFNIV